MKQLFLVATLFVLGTVTQGCVIKTSSTGDPASPASNTSSAATPADPSPARPPAAPAPAASPAKPAASPAPAPAKPAASPPAPAPAKPAAAPAAGAKQVDAPVRPAQPAPAPTARPAQPAPPPSAPQKDTAAPPKKPPQPVFTPPPKPKAPPAERKADDANGVPPSMKEGAPLAYWIWRDKDGATWHLRTTAGGKLHRFQGRIWVDGTLSDLKSMRLEINDRLKKEDEGVLLFDFVTDVSIDGFDFKVAAGRCVTFHLLIDGKPAPQEVEIGQKEIAVGTATFRLCR